MCDDERPCWDRIQSRFWIGWALMPRRVMTGRREALSEVHNYYFGQIIIFGSHCGVVRHSIIDAYAPGAIYEKTVYPGSRPQGRVPERSAVHRNGRKNCFY